jgi:hypothetical protein
VSHSGTQQLSRRLSTLVQEILGELPELESKVDEADKVTKHLFKRLLVATDYASGCVNLGDAGLGSPLVVIVRCLFESFIGTYWGSQSDKNGHALLASAERELMRVMKLNLSKGHARIVEKDTGQNRTGSFLRDPRLAEAERLTRFDRMAEEAGIRKIYDQLYGLLSLLSHSSAADILAKRDQMEMIQTHLPAATAFLQCIRLIVSARVRDKRIAKLEEIESILKISLGRTTTA